MSQSLNIALRSIINARFYSLVSVVGLGIAIAVVLLVALLVKHETSYDRAYDKADSIFRVTWVDMGTGDRFATAFNPISPQMKADFPQVIEAARLGVFEQTLQRTDDSGVADSASVRFENIAMVDPGIFSLFDFDFIAGGPESLAQPDTIVLTQAGAEHYFPGENPMGKTLLLGSKVALTVSGLINDMPETSHITTHFFVPLETLRAIYDRAGFIENWGSDVFYHYVLLEESTDASALAKQLPEFLQRHDPEWPLGSVEIELQPLTSLHFITDMQNDMPVRDTVLNTTKAPRQSTDLVLFSAGAFFLVLVASFNFMNLQVARSIGRGKQLGMLKVLGANRRQVVTQILLESILLCAMSFAVALVLVEMALDSFSAILAVNLTWSQLLTPGFAGLALVATIALGLLAGAYPAVLMASQSPSQVMRGEFKLGLGAARVRSLLVLLQFSASVILIAVSLVIYAQIRYSLSVPLGFEHDNIAVVELGRDNRQHFDALKARVEVDPTVQSMTKATIYPTDNLSDGGSLMTEGGQNEIAMRTVMTEFGYFQTLGIDVVAGRPFKPEFGSDRFKFASAETPNVDNGIIINRAAARRAGWMEGEDVSAAIGQVMSTEHIVDGVLMTMRMHVVGVVEDVHFRSLRSEIVPMSYYLTGWGSKVAVRFESGVERAEAEKILRDAWDGLVTGAPLRLSWLEDSVDELYAQEHRSLQLISSIALLAVVVACLGLFAVATLVTGLRTREIGLRKILGAGVRELVNMLSWQFLKPVLLANLVAWPLAWLYLNDWLQLFAYRVDLQWSHFLLPAGVATAIAWVTVAGHALRVAMNNPIKALRYES
jgi:putative ABC transport system permease protein